MSQAGIAVSSGGGGGSSVETLTGNSGGAVPATANNINVVGSGGVTVVGNPGTSTLTISVGGTGFSWNDEAVSFNAVPSNGYFCTSALTATLPSGSQGDSIKFINASSAHIVIQAASGQIIQIGMAQSSSSGSATSITNGDSVTLVYRNSSQIWYSDGGPEGTWELD